MDLERFRQISLGGTLAREIARLDEERASWRKAMVDTDVVGKHLRELSEGSTYAKMAMALKASQLPAMTVAQQAYKTWRESEQTELVRMRRMFDPMAEIRRSVLADSGTQQLIKELTEGSSIRSYAKDLMEQASGVGSVAKMLSQQAEESRAHTKQVLEGLGVGSSIQSYLKDFERISKQWQVPSEVLGIVGSFREIQDQLGKVALPTIDWGSAAALARVLGPEGIQQQLALLGIEPDGSMRAPSETPERGILSRKQSDAIALISLLLGILFFIYQEYSSGQQQAKTDAFQTQTTATLQVQAQQIQNLTILIERALVQAASTPEERFVVRERTATVRAKPQHGSIIEAQLMPNEVVRAIHKEGKWVEVEFYHWLYEEYRTGWVLKKYLERVPTNYEKAAK